MKILHLNYDDIKNPWAGGGAAFGTFRINKILASEGHDITVITGNYPNAEKEEEIEGVFYRRIGFSKNFIISILTYSLYVKKLIKSLDYDLLVDDFNPYFPSFSPLCTKKPIVCIVRMVYSTHLIKKHNLLGIIPLGIIPFLSEKIGLKMYKNFIAVSPSTAEQLKKEIGVGKRIEVIPNGVDDSLFLTKVLEKPYILFLGRIDIYHKGLDTLLEAFKDVINHIEDHIDLIIAGGGRDINKLKKLIFKFNLENNVKLVGRVYGRKKEELLSNCLFVCMPSRIESFGRVAIEASACEKPVIGTKIPGLWDTIKDGHTGVLITDYSNTKRLSKAMLELISDKELRKKLGRNGREWARNFSHYKTAKMTEKFYYDCLNDININHFTENEET